MGVCPRGGEDGVEPMVVTAVGYIGVFVYCGDDVEIQIIVVGAIVGGVISGVVVDTRFGERIAMPDIISAGVYSLNIGLCVGECKVEVVDAVANARAEGGHNGVAIQTRLLIGGATPVVGTAGAVNRFIADERCVDRKVEDEKGVVGSINEMDYSVGGVCLTIGSPCVGSTSGGIEGDNGALCFVLGEGQRHDSNGQ